MIDKKQLIAAALLDGADPRARLIEAGISAASADYEVKRLDKDPMAAALRLAVRRLYKRDWTLRLQGKLAAVRDGGLEVPRVSGIAPARFYEDYYAANRPVVLEGLVDHWPAIELWTLDYLDEKVGGAVVQVQFGRDAGHSELDKEKMAGAAHVRDISASIRAVESSNDFYVTAYDSDANRTALADLWGDLGSLSILRDEDGRTGFFWLGPKGTLTPFHHDLTNNLLVQILGRKKVRLVPSWEVGRMRNFLHCYSSRDPSDWDKADEDLPLMVEVMISPGDALFLPIGWWHHVEALDPSISMSYTNFAADNDFATGYEGYCEY